MNITEHPERSPRVGDKVILDQTKWPVYVVDQIHGGQAKVRMVRALERFTVIEVDHG